MKRSTVKPKHPDCERHVAAHVAAKNNVPFWLLNMIVSAQSQYIKQVMSSGLLQDIVVPGFGVFKPRWKKIRGIRSGVYSSTKEGHAYFKHRARKMLEKNASDV